MSNLHPVYTFFKSNEPVKPEATQKCISCKEERPLHFFNKDFAGDNSRLRSVCRVCNWNSRQFLSDLRETLVQPFWDEDAGQGDPCQRPGCGRTDRKLTLDHDHDTKEPRGWLCPSCNLSIGQLGDKKENMFETIEYFENAEKGLNIEYLQPNPQAEEFFPSEAQ